MSKIVKNTLIYTLGRILPQLAGIILLPIYTLYMSPEEYGIVQAMQVIITVLAIFLSLATERSMARLYFDYKTEKGQKILIGNATILVFLTATICLILMMLFRNYIAKIYSSIDFYPFYFYAILNAYILAYTNIPKVVFQVKEKAGVFFWISMLQFISGVVFILYFIVIAHQGAEGMLKGQFWGNLVMMPLFFYFIIRQSSFRPKISVAKSILIYSLPIVPSLIFAWVMNLSDRIFIEHYFTLRDVGIYSLGYKIAGIVALFTGAFNAAYTPIFYKIANDSKEINPKLKLKNFNHTFIMVVIFISFGIAFTAKETIGIFLNVRYLEAWKVVNLICLSYLVSTSAGLLNLMIYQEKKTLWMLFIISISAVANTTMNFVLIPWIGPMGAAWATLISSLVFFVIAYQYARRFYFIPFSWSKIFVLLIPLFGICLINYFLEIPYTLVPFLIKIAFIILLGYVIYKYSKSEILAILRK